MDSICDTTRFAPRTNSAWLALVVIRRNALELAALSARLPPLSVPEFASRVNAFVDKRGHEFKISDIVILPIAVNVVDKEADGHRPTMLAPDSPMSHFTVNSDVALRSNSTSTVLTSLHDKSPISDWSILYSTVRVLSSPLFLSALELFAQ